MGRSKFPGKPTKLVNKKRISVLSGNCTNSDSLVNNIDDDFDRNDLITSNDQITLWNNQNGLITASTTANLQSTNSHDGDGNNIQKLIETSSNEQSPPPSKPPDDNTNLDNEINKKNNSAGIQTRARTNPLMNNKHIKEEKKEKQQQLIKKKTVTFKNVLETSDDVIVKKVYNPDGAPLVPIIKKECLIRSSRLLKTECLVRPSRLTEILKNNENNIDKLNSITFRSVPQIPTSILSTYESSSSIIKNNNCDVVVMGDKRFILPKRSVHSCRVIKPNKRFFDEVENTIKRKNSISSPVKKLNNKKLSLKDETQTSVGKDRIDYSKVKGEYDEEEEYEDDDDREPDRDESETSRSEEESECNHSENEIQQERQLMSTSMKVILRQPRLQFPTLSTLGNTNVNDGPFSMNLNNITTSNLGSLTSLSACKICGTTSSFRFQQPSQKFGVISCEACRKFISKAIKKLAATTSLLNVQPQHNTIECLKSDGFCTISPICQKTNHLKPLRSTIKDRCTACWLKKCIKTFQIPSGLRQRLIGTLPLNMRDLDICNNSGSSSQLSPFSIKKETSDTNSIFTTTSSTTGGRLLSWPQDCVEMDYKTSKIVSLSNSLAENNSTFGSLPLIKPNITEKPIIMINSNIDIIKSDFVKKDIRQQINGANLNKIQIEGENNKLEETNKIKTRKKDREQIQQISTPTIEQPKRQRIDLKGPRVKHVCRSASIVLGQPIATFPNESPLLETMDTPPRPGSPNNDIVDIPQSIITHPESECTDCVTNPDVLGLSPPATPIENKDEELGVVIEETKEDDLIDIETAGFAVADFNKENRKLEESQKPVTRKITRPALLSQTVTNITNRNNIISISRKQENPAPPVISIDFWENYDPAEVSRTGFGLIVTESVPLRALCFLCGSSGLDPLIFCVCCCEPYHQYCVEDEYNLKQPILDETGTSFLDNSTLVNQSSLNNRLNWLCPRCTVCYTCNMSSGSKLKCQKCQKNYHSTCLGTSKRLLGADRPLICANCLKCKSCGTSNVSKFVGNLPMCQACFKLRQRGNFCPLCQKCYEDNDFDLKMMECGDCKRWVHARCEGVPDEQYNMLSALPENIEFICKKCSKNNSTSETWREAVLAEFKSGLLSVIKLLSKSRQACALLKLSPRKKSSNCICQPVISNRCIQFNPESQLKDDGDKNSLDGEMQALDDGYKCFCGAVQRQQMNFSSTVPTLLDVKRKINASEYYSVQDFNYDMQLVIHAVACDDLLTTYKEILSETFPWFQNETKACTDALVEDMYDSSSYNETPPILDLDQQVPMIDVPEDSDNYFYSTPEQGDNRVCMFCKSIGEGMANHESRLLYCGHNTWVHTNCALWSAEVFEEIDGSLQNVHSAIKRGRAIKCSLCKNKGATVGCNAKKCDEQFHYPCARSGGCAFLLDKTVYCPIHILETSENKCQMEKNFEVLRPVYVELDRRKKKMIDPSNIQFLIGSLCVKKLGHFIPVLSDYQDAIVPTDFLCTRLFWSSKEPWKIVEYTVKTSIQNNYLSQSYDTGKNFTVDHSSNYNIVQLGLAQITKYHNSLVNGEDYEILLRQDKSVKQLLDAVMNNSNEETNEEEPQNNADLLPDEIKDVIFDDLPHELLDGISMLDILPKLMTYEDLVALDMKNEAYFGGDLLKEGKEDSSEDEMDNSQKNSEITIWPGSNSSLLHVEDALLSTRSITGTTSRELKRSKSEVFSRSVAANRSHQRSCSLTWSCKLDTSSAAKRRKVSMFQDLKLPESVLLSFGRGDMKYRKEDIPENISERRRSLQTEEIKPNRALTWTATKKLIHNDSIIEAESIVPKDVLDRLKISQLDGVDDIGSGSDSGSPIYEHSNSIQLTGIYNSTNSTNECPVKCDRCHCTYRTYESFQRHLPSCEPMSTSESESEATPRSPENETPPTQQQNSNGIMTSVSVSEVFSANSINQFVSPQTHHQQNGQTLSFLPQLNGQNLIHNVTLSNSIPITNLQNTMTPIHNVNSNNLQNGIPINSANVQNHLQHGMSNMLVTTSQNQHQHQQQQIFTQSIPVNNFQQQIFPLQNQFQTTNTLQQHQQQSQQQHPQIITLPNGMNIQNYNNQTTHLLQQQPQQQQQTQQQQQQIHQNQPQIIQISTPNGPQLMAISPQQLKTTGTSLQQQNVQQPTPSINSPIKNQLILPQPEKNSSKKQTRFQSPSTRGKGRPITNAKPIQMKRIMKSDNKLNHMVNTNYPVVRTNGSTHNGQNVLFQQQNSQPIIVQQMGNNQNNLVQYVTDGHNTMQYLMPTTTNDFKQPQQQYLAQNPMVPGTYQLQTDAVGNLVLANTPTGLSILPGTVQLAQTQQPQVIGAILQPQATQFQCGMMASEQMVLGSTPTLEMVTDPASGCMYLTSQPVYYGLETIVRNTVMSSQQFVSTAMQGVLSQNSSFSATTTQVFQASKIEPFMEMPTGYVVLNNVGDQSVNLNMMPQQNQQQNLVQTNVLQQPTVQHIQPQLQQQSQPTWQFIKDDPSQTLNIQQTQSQQIRPSSPPKSTVKSSLVVTKIQPQIVNKVLPHGTPIIPAESKPPIILPKLTTLMDQNTFMQQPHINNVQQKSLNNLQKPMIMPSTPIPVNRATTKSAAVKPKLITKTSNINKLQYSTAGSIKPILNPTVKMSQVPTSLQTHQLIVPLKHSQQFQCENMNATVEKEIIQQPIGEEIMSIQNLQNQIMTSNPVDIIQPVTDTQIAHSVPLSLNLPQQPPSIVLPHQTSHIYQPQNTSASQTTINLPIAPYAPPPHSNGIPMSVVNPIQQYHHNNNSITRPTNRVLPMQTHQLKPSPPSPPTPPEPKLLITEIEDKFLTSDNVIKENLSELMSPNLVIDGKSNEITENENKSFENFMKNNIKLRSDNSMLNVTTHKEQDEQMISINEVIKNESNLLDSKDDCDNTDVKEKICQILVNLENEDCNRNVVNMEETQIYSITEESEQKENLDPEMIETDEMNTRYQHRSPLKENYFQSQQPLKPKGPKMLYEIQSQDGFTYKSTSISEVWDKVFEAVQIARKAHGLVPLPEGPLGEMSGFQMLGLKTNALKYLLEQLPGVEKCDKYIPKYHKRDPSQPNVIDYSIELEDFKENEHGAIRCEPYVSRSEYDMFSWLASRHRKQPAPVVIVMENDITIPRRGSGSNLPMAMRYRTLKETSKESVGVYRSHIHGRGLFCTRDIEAGEMVIEYAGELIRSTLTDKREKYYDSKGIGCYMFKIDDNLVVDATMRGNAARFINHSCEPNCYSKVVDILGHKHIIIFALRRIIQGEELTYDYKFPFEDVKIPCSCGSKRCRKYLN